MQSGVISQDNFSQVLREISQKKRQGCLQLNTGDQELFILFSKGRIVECFTTEDSPVQATIKFLARAGEEFQHLPSASDYAGLAEAVEPLGLSSERLKEVIQHRVLETLYTIDLGGGTYYQFHVQSMDFDVNFTPAISVGQLLLDFVAREDQASRFRSGFVEETIVRLTDTLPANPSREEEILVETLVGPMEVQQLQAESLLSDFHFYEAFLALYEQGVLQKGGGAPEVGEGSTQADEEVDTGALAGIEAAIDAAVTDELAQSQPSSSAPQGVGALVAESKPVAQEAHVDEPKKEADKEVPNERPAALSGVSGLKKTNTKLLHSRVPVGAVSIVFVLAALGAPWFFWTELFELFAR